MQVCELGTSSHYIFLLDDDTDYWIFYLRYATLIQNITYVDKRMKKVVSVPPPKPLHCLPVIYRIILKICTFTCQICPRRVNNIIGNRAVWLAVLIRWVCFHLVLNRHQSELLPAAQLIYAHSANSYFGTYSFIKDADRPMNLWDNSTVRKQQDS